MQETTVSKVICKGCLREIVNHEVNGERVPCQICGSTRRDFRDTVICHMAMGGK